MSGDWEIFQQLKESFTCSHCRAKPGYPCLDKNGKRYHLFHASRGNQAWNLIDLAATPPTDQQRLWAGRLAKEWNR